MQNHIMKKPFLQHRNKLVIKYSKNDQNYITLFFMLSGGTI